MSNQDPEQIDSMLILAVVLKRKGWKKISRWLLQIKVMYVTTTSVKTG